MPRSSVLVRAAQAASKSLGKFGGVLYYEWRWPTHGAGAHEQSGPLIDYVTSFYASRNAVNGFQMVASKQSQHPTFELMPTETARRLLEEGGASTKSDLNAFNMISLKVTQSPQHSEAAALVCAPYRVVWEAKQWAQPQHSNATVAALATDPLGEPTGDSSTAVTAVSATGSTASGRSDEATALPAWGTDPDFDAYSPQRLL